MNTQAATSQQVADYLTEQGFTFEGLHGEYDAWWFRKGCVRVATEDEGYYTIHVFDPRYQRPMNRRDAFVQAWETKVSNAPLSAIAAMITAARQSVAAELLPTD